MSMLKTYGRRNGRKLRGTKQALMDTFLPKVQLDLGKNPEDFDWAPYKDCLFEIGFGAGEHLALQAAEDPHTPMIGCEPFVNGVANLLEKIEEGNLTNIHIYPGNALDLLTVMPDDFIQQLFLLFPDPWPKKGHHKRRFVQKETLDLLARKLKPGGKLLIATDHADYFEWICERALHHETLQCLNPEESSWLKAPALWTRTRFQTKADKAGRVSRFLWFGRG